MALHSLASLAMTAGMLEIFQEHQTAVYCVGIGSAILFVATLFAVPVVIARIPADYFAHEKRPPSRWVGRHPMLRVPLAIGRNLLGGVLILAGLAMILLPGQGLLTMLIGFLMMDFRGKYRMEKRLLARPRIRASLDWMRRRAGREPLQVAS